MGVAVNPICVVVCVTCAIALGGQLVSCASPAGPSSMGPSGNGVPAKEDELDANARRVADAALPSDSTATSLQDLGESGDLSSDGDLHDLDPQDVGELGEMDCVPPPDMPTDTYCPGGNCDDGIYCTKDECYFQKCGNLAIGHCSVIASSCQEGCKTSDPCLHAICIAGACIEELDPARPGCCSDLVNTTCDDKSSATTDSCSKTMPGGWFQCENKLNPMFACSFVDNYKCNDGNACTVDTMDEYCHCHHDYK